MMRFSQGLGSFFIRMESRGSVRTIIYLSKGHFRIFNFLENIFGTVNLIQL